MHATRPAGTAPSTGTGGEEGFSRTGGPSRRHFLKQLSVGAAGLGLLHPSALVAQSGGTPDTEAPLTPTSNPQSVVVVGAGLSGWAPQVDLEEGMERTARWLTEEGPLSS